VEEPTPEAHAGARPIGMQENTYDRAKPISLPAAVDLAILRSS
jgi:hypothetical protein